MKQISPSQTDAEPASFKPETVGIILGTERFTSCVRFYAEILALPIWFTKPGLVCLHFGDGYLMIEHGGHACDGVKPSNANPTMLRFNVADVHKSAAALEARGVPVDICKYEWGLVGSFHDPDGNKCELKDAGDPFFAKPNSPFA